VAKVSKPANLTFTVVSFSAYLPKTPSVTLIIASTSEGLFLISIIVAGTGRIIPDQLLLEIATYNLV
jgi:hypothetical protein